jgi:hypothetical protein
MAIRINNNNNASTTTTTMALLDITPSVLIEKDFVYGADPDNANKLTSKIKFVRLHCSDRGPNDYLSRTSLLTISSYDFLRAIIPMEEHEQQVGRIELSLNEQKRKRMIVETMNIHYNGKTMITLNDFFLNYSKELFFAIQNAMKEIHSHNQQQHQ